MIMKEVKWEDLKEEIEVDHKEEIWEDLKVKIEEDHKEVIREDNMEKIEENHKEVIWEVKASMEKEDKDVIKMSKLGKMHITWNIDVIIKISYIL